MSFNPHRRHRAWRAVSAGSALSMLLAAGVIVTAAGPASADPKPAPSPTTDTPTASTVTAERALSQAHETHKDVQATAATTPDSTLTAHPDGTFTVAQSLAPVRKWSGTAWVKLDPTLKRSTDGSITPAATTSSLTLSGGGTGPLVRMVNRGRNLSLTLPVRLPAPALSGPTATYADLLPGVDLVATADVQGSVSEVLVIKNAKAATNPALRTLTWATTSRNLKVTANKAGAITALAGRDPVFTAATPMMWDSRRPVSTGSAAAPAVRNPRTGLLVDSRTGDPIESSPAAPGAHAHTTALGVTTTQTDQGHGTINLAPDAAQISNSDVTYPMYMSLDLAPGTSPAPSSLQGWTYTNSYYSTSTFWKTTEELRVGYTDDPHYPPNYTARSYLQLSVPSVLYGSTVDTSQLNINEDWAWSCTPETVELWTTASGISPATDWDNQPAKKTYVDGHSVAHGWSSACPAANIGFNLKTPMQAAANSGTARSLTFVLKAPDGDETNDLYWKKLVPSSVTVTTTYDHPPRKPTQLSTSPTTSCTDSTIVGDGSVTLYAGVSDPDGGTVGTYFKLMPHGASTPIIAKSDATKLTNQSGSTAVFVIPKATLESAANGQVTTFDWNAQVSDGTYWGDTSATCDFQFDPTRTGAPVVDQITDGTTTIGAPGSVTIKPPVKDPNDPHPYILPTSYEYQLNGGAPLNAKVDSMGSATVTITPARRTNVLTVTSLSAGGNYGDSASIHFNSKAPAAPADGDLSGDDIPDLLTVGNQDNLPPGLWLANSESNPKSTVGNGHINSAATDIGANGNGSNTIGTAADFNGAQAITGRFSDSGLQDVLVYYPATGTGAVISGNGDGSALATHDNSNVHDIDAFTDDTLVDDPPSQIANAGATAGTQSYPDLLGTFGETLTLYKCQGAVGSWTGHPLTVNSPDGTADWSSWTLASMQLPPDSSSPGTALFLWNKSTGQLDLWENLVYDGADTTVTYTDYHVAANWNTGTNVALQAADINGDDTPDLWTVGSAGTVTAHLFGNLSTTPTEAQTVDALTAPAHAWPLNDTANGAISAAADTAGSLPATGSGGVTGTTGDLFSPAAHFDGSGVLSTGGPAVSTNSDFTVSAWVKPSSLGGYVMGQKGTHTSGFALFSDAATKSWRFEMPRSDADNPTEDLAAATTIPAQVGTWVRLTGTYTASTGRMVLYIDDVAAAQAGHTTKWNATGGLTAGAYWYNDATTGHFVGDIADLQTFPQALTAKQVAILAGNPGPTSYAHINDNHDFNGDQAADVIGVRSDGTLHLYTGAAESNLLDGGQLWDSSWGSMRLMTSGNFTDAQGDSNADVIGIRPDGSAWLYIGNGKSGLDTGGQLIGGTTWSTVLQIAAADFNGDGHTDLLAIWGDGTIHMYAGDGNGHIGSAGPSMWPDTSWKTMRLLAAGDFNNDTHADLLGEWPDGSLHLYNGDGNGHLTQGTQLLGGTSWTTVKGIVPGDFTNDGLTDLVAVWGSDGTIRPYAGDGNGNLGKAGPNMWPDDSWKSMGLIA